MSNPEEPTPQPHNPEPTALPPASELPPSAPLVPEPTEGAAPPAQPIYPPVDPNAATQVYPATQTSPGAPVPPDGPSDPGGAVPPVYPGGPASPAYGAPAPQAPMNTLAIVSFVGSFFIGLVGIICGHIALRQIKRDGTRGRGLALAGTIIGYVNTVIWIIAVIATVVFGIAAAGIASSTVSEIEKSDSSTSQEAPSDGLTDEGSSGTEASGEFCAVLDEIATLDPSDSVAVADAYQRLADASPSEESREVYQFMADLAADPASAVDEQNFAEMTETFTETLINDSMACY